MRFWNEPHRTPDGLCDAGNLGAGDSLADARIDLATHGMGWPEDIECEEVKAEVEVRCFPSA